MPKTVQAAVLRGPAAPLLLAVAGFLGVFLPTWVSLTGSVWRESDELHGPLLLAMAGWAFWRARARLVWLVAGATDGDAWKAAGWGGLMAGLALCILGRVAEVRVLEAGAQAFVASGLLLLLGGRESLVASAYPLVFLALSIPLPGNFVDSATGALKQLVSVITEGALHLAGYPVARSGVVLTIGQYQVLVADACSGLKSMFSLSAVGVLYVYVTGHVQRWRNVVLLVALLPIAFLANVARVLVLVLVTYHVGADAAQGFLHDFAGVFLFVAAVVLLFALDGLLGQLVRTRAEKGRP